MTNGVVTLRRRFEDDRVARRTAPSRKTSSAGFPHERGVVADGAIEDAWSASFFARLPSGAQAQLMATANEEQLFVGQNVYRELTEPRFSFLALVISGLLRAYATSPHGRRVVTRYWRPGQVMGLTSAILHGAPTGVEVVREGSMLRLDPLVLQRLARTDASVGWILCEELAERLVIAARGRIPSVFGSVRMRVAGHLLELASEVDGRCAVRVTQQELADSVGSVREVVARVLLGMSHDGLITRKGPLIVIDDWERLSQLSHLYDE